MFNCPAIAFEQVRIKIQRAVSRIVPNVLSSSSSKLSRMRALYLLQSAFNHSAKTGPPHIHTLHCELQQYVALGCIQHREKKVFPVHPVQFEIIIRLNSEDTRDFKQGRPLQALHSALSVGQEHSATMHYILSLYLNFT